MIVFDLRCAHDHVFEAWFGSSASYEEQRARNLIACPICGDGQVAKAVMAPNVPAKGNRADAPPPDSAAVKTALAALARAQQAALDQSRWVGNSFASEARAMHNGEVDAAPIHGRASLAEAKALVADGVPVAPLPFPVVPPDERN